jgi:hypothetical protein
MLYSSITASCLLNMLLTPSFSSLQFWNSKLQFWEKWEREQGGISSASISEWKWCQPFNGITRENRKRLALLQFLFYRIFFQNQLSIICFSSNPKISVEFNSFGVFFFHNWCSVSTILIYIYMHRISHSPPRKKKQRKKCKEKRKGEKKRGKHR